MSRTKCEREFFQTQTTTHVLVYSALVAVENWSTLRTLLIML